MAKWGANSTTFQASKNCRCKGLRLVRRLAACSSVYFTAHKARLIRTKKYEQGANSTGWAGRPNALFFPKFFTFSLGMVDGMSGVHTGPGATAFTRMPLGTTIFERALVKLTMAALDGA
jgi:hypothetical protein